MRVQRNLGDLKSRLTPTWMNRLKQMFAPHQPMNLAGHQGSYLVLSPSLSGKVLHVRRSLLPEQKFKLRELLNQNINVCDLAGAFDADVIDRGVLSLRVVTTAGVTFLANNFAGSGAAISTFKYHGFGTGTTAEAVGDTALVTEFTTEYATDSTRPTGSQASSANVYTTVGTFSPDTGGTLAVTEHGIFSAASAGTLWDRSKFSAVNLVAGSDSLQVTYNLTLSAGG